MTKLHKDFPQYVAVEVYGKSPANPTGEPEIRHIMNIEGAQQYIEVFNQTRTGMMEARARIRPITWKLADEPEGGAA